MQHAVNLKLNDAVDTLGSRLSSRNFDAPARFSFRWAGFRFKGSLRAREDGGNELELTARLGFLPFTAEDGACRREIVEGLTRHFSDLEGCYEITRSGEIQCVATTAFDGPVEAVPVAQCLTLTMLHLRKLLTRFEGLLVPVS